MITPTKTFEMEGELRRQRDVFIRLMATVNHITEDDVADVGLNVLHHLWERGTIHDKTLVEMAMAKKHYNIEVFKEASGQ